MHGRNPCSGARGGVKFNGGEVDAAAAGDFPKRSAVARAWIDRSIGWDKTSNSLIRRASSMGKRVVPKL
jgi:hypothetical protein